MKITRFRTSAPMLGPSKLIVAVPGRFNDAKVKALLPVAPAREVVMFKEPDCRLSAPIVSANAVLDPSLENVKSPPNELNTVELPTRLVLLDALVLVIRNSVPTFVAFVASGAPARLMAEGLLSEPPPDNSNDNCRMFTMPLVLIAPVIFTLLPAWPVLPRSVIFPLTVAEPLMLRLRWVP